MIGTNIKHLPVVRYSARDFICVPSLVKPCESSVIIPEMLWNLPNVTELVNGRTQDLNSSLSDFQARTLTTGQTALAWIYRQAAEAPVFPVEQRSREALLKCQSELIFGDQIVLRLHL